MAFSSPQVDFKVPPLLAKRYELQDELGHGGMGVVYRCRDRMGGRLYAVKFLTASRLNDKEEVRRFQHEAKVLTMLQHPNIIRVLDYGIEGQYPYLVSELCVRLDGRPHSLEELQQASRERQVSPGLMETLIPPVIGALAALHGKGLIHRDIKPSNILLHETSRNRFVPKLSDFGLVAITGDEAMRDLMEFSMSIEQESSTSRSLVGTYSYMSPEQKLGEVLDARSDVYSLGLMIYRLATGYERVSFKLPSEVVPAMAGWFDEIVKDSVDTDKAQRAPNAGVLLLHVPAELRPPIVSEPLLKKEQEEDKKNVSEAELDSRFGGTIQHVVKPWKVGLAVFGVGAMVAALIAAIHFLLPGKPPPSPGPSAIELLNSQDHQQVLAGLMMLEHSRTANGQDVLPRIRGILLRDPDLRHDALPVVCELSRDDPRLRPLLLEILGGTPDQEAMLQIIEVAHFWDPPPEGLLEGAYTTFERLSAPLNEPAIQLLATLEVPAEPRYLDYFLYQNDLDTASAIAEQAPDALLQAIVADEPKVWEHAVDLLPRLTVSRATVEAALIKRLLAEGGSSQSRARVALSAMGAAAVPDLAAALTGKPAADQALIGVLKAIGVKETAPFARYFLVTGDVDALVRIGQPAVVALTAALQEPALQQTALEALKRLGGHSADALPSLIDLLRDQQAGNDAEALVALAALGPDAQDALQAILPFIQMRDAEKAALAAAVLHGLQVPVSYETWPYFSYTLSTDSPAGSRLRALEAAGKLGQELPLAREMLMDVIRKDPRGTEARAAAVALGQAGRAAVPAVRELLQAQSVVLKGHGLAACRQLGAAAEPLIPEVVPLLGNPDLGNAATDALVSIGAPAIEPTISALGTPGSRDQAVHVLARLREPALFRLRNQLAEGTNQARAQVLFAITEMGRKAESAVPDLRRALQQPSLYPQEDVLRALVAIGPPSQPAIPEIKELVAGNNEKLRQLAMTALAQLGKPGIEALGELLKHPDARVRNSVLELLLKEQAAVKPDVSVLIRAYRMSPVGGKRSDILAAIGRYKPAEGRSAVPLLLEALDDDSSVVRRQAAQSLGQLGVSTPEIIAKLEKAREDQEWLVRENALEALRKLKQAQQE